MIDPNATTTYTVEVPEDKAGLRLDKLLAGALKQFSRSRLKALIESGRVICDGGGGEAGELAAAAARRVKAGQVFTLSVPAARPARPQPQEIALQVVFEDADLIVIDKPAGMVVHPAPGHPDGTLVNALLAHCSGSLSGIGGITRPGIVHRLDKDTSGLMVAAKNDAAHRCLAGQFAEHTVERAYQAVVWGVVDPPAGEISANIGRNPANRLKMAVLDRGGKPALTGYKTIKSFASLASLVECRLATGRTHQIRVHLAALGHPVLGDPLYGGGARGRRKNVPHEAVGAAKILNRQALHALVIGFSPPNSPKTLRFQSFLPHDIKELIRSLDAI